jgi:hypothetical protein
VGSSSSLQKRPNQRVESDNEDRQHADQPEDRSVRLHSIRIGNGVSDPAQAVGPAGDEVKQQLGSTESTGPDDHQADGDALDIILDQPQPALFVLLVLIESVVTRQINRQTDRQYHPSQDIGFHSYCKALTLFGHPSRPSYFHRTTALLSSIVIR